MSKDFKIATRKSQKTEEKADDIIKAIQAEDKLDDRKRINFDIPLYLFDLMEKKIKGRGYTMKGYIAALIRKDLGEE
jgi:hypothetical protein